MAPISSQLQDVLVTLGCGFIVAAIAGGGVELKDFKIPKILSLKRQLILAGFGATLVLVFTGFVGVVLQTLVQSNPPWGSLFEFLFLIFWVFLMAGGFISEGVRAQKLGKFLAENRHNTNELLARADKEFWDRNYKGAMKLILQAKSAGNPETWEPAYGILLGAQLGVAQNASTWDLRPVSARKQPLPQETSANATRDDLIALMRKAAQERVGYFSSPGDLRKLMADLSAMRPIIAPDGMVERYREPARAAIDLVLSAAKELLNSQS